MTVSLRWYQQNAVDAVLNTDLKNPVLGLPTGCHAAGHPILMFDGSTKRVEDVRVGDVLMGNDGTPRNVLMLRGGRSRMVRIEGGGLSFVVNEEHKLSAVFRGRDSVFKAKKLIGHPFQFFRSVSGSIVRIDGRATSAPKDFFFGFTVDGNNRYLDGNGVHHRNSGKSHTAAAIIRNMLDSGKITRAVIATHTGVLVDQNHQDYVTHWKKGESVGVVSASVSSKKDWAADVVFGSVGTLMRNPGKLGPRDVLLIDECHRVSSDPKSGYATLINALRYHRPEMPVIGMTATYWRLGEGLLWEVENPIFDGIAYDLCTGPDFTRLVDEGYLAPLVTQETSSHVDLSGVRTQAGDFNQADLSEAVERSVADAVPEFLELAKDRKHGMVFVAGTENCERVCEAINENGEKAIYVHSKLSTAENQRRIADFKSGTYRWIVSDASLTTGFNCPDVDVIVLLKPTKSSASHVQMLGRGTRPFPGKINCLVLDFAGNIGRNGPINMPVIPKGAKAREREIKANLPKVKTCPSCGLDNDIDADVCANVACGFRFPPVDEKELLVAAKASNLKAMVVQRHRYINPSKLWLWHGRTHDACVLMNKQGMRFLKIGLAGKFGYTLNAKAVSDLGYPSIDEAVTRITEEGFNVGAVAWDTDVEKYPKKARNAGEVNPRDLYWFPLINGECRAAFIASVCNERPISIDLIKRGAEIVGVKHVHHSYVQEQARLVRVAMQKRHIPVTSDSVAKYIDSINQD